MELNAIIIDKIKWWISGSIQIGRHPIPICPVHNLRLDAVKNSYETYFNERTCTKLECEECKDLYFLPRALDKEKKYVINKVDAKAFKQMKFINLDDEALPIAEEKVQKNSEYFVTSLLTQSKIGLRLVIYAGKRGSSQKTQIFVEPEIKRLAFDQKDLHPSDVFTKVEAVFSDNTIAKIEKGGEKNG